MKCLLALTLALSSTASAQTTPQVIHLWPNGAPGFESRKDIPEQAQDYWVRNVNNPSITVYLPPKEKATGAAVLIAPGGGFRELVFNAEGVQAAQFLNSIGVAAFALKYRLPQEKDSPYSMDNVRQDANRAMRLIRSRSAEFNIDPHRVGFHHAQPAAGDDRQRFDRGQPSCPPQHQQRRQRHSHCQQNQSGQGCQSYRQGERLPIHCL